MGVAHRYAVEAFQAYLRCQEAVCHFLNGRAVARIVNDPAVGGTRLYCSEGQRKQLL